MHWVLQGGSLFDAHEWADMIGTLERFAIPYSVHDVVPFVGQLVPDIDPTNARVICFGSYSMRHAAAAKRWSPGVYDLADFDFEMQRDHWGQRLLNFDSAVTSFGELRLPAAKFVRPVDDTKAFTGRIFEPEAVAEGQDRVRSLGPEHTGTLTSGTKVQVSEPRVIFQEVRYWIVGGEIVTRSIYRSGDTVRYDDCVDERYDEFVREVVTAWQPLPAFVVDVCDTPEGLRIVEINTINSAGFYAGNIQSVVLALEALNAT